MKNNLLSAIAFIMVFLLFSFSGRDIGLKDIPSPFNKTFSFISPGKVIIKGSPDEFNGFVLEGTADTINTEVSAFYMSKFEVSNEEYNTFLKEYKKNADQNEWELVNIDSTKWMNYVTYASPFVTHYHSHEAYKDHPVVNISHEGALAYCDWLTNKVNAQMNEGSITFRLPTKEEWVRAARSDEHGYSYVWGTENAVDEKGVQRCNFNKNKKPHEKLGGLGNSKTKKPVVVVGTMNRLKSDVNMTSPVRTFEPSKNDLYNMNGNVAEMLNEKFVAMGGCWNSSSSEVRIESEMSYIAPSPYIGFRPVMVIN